ncbi:MAG: hypothetical protein WED11_07235, partial [Natronospirillum sp.]
MTYNRPSPRLHHLRTSLLVIWLMLVLPVSAKAEAVIGRIISAVGDVVALRQDGEERALRRRDTIMEGDTIRTGEEGRTQIRFIDDALVDLRPN